MCKSSPIWCAVVSWAHNEMIFLKMPLFNQNKIKKPNVILPNKPNLISINPHEGVRAEVSHCPRNRAPVFFVGRRLRQK